MSEKENPFVKPDVSSPLKKRDSYLVIKEDDPTLVTVDRVDEVKVSTDGGIKDAVRVTCREILTKENLDEDDVKTFEFIATEETKIKESYSTSSWYLLKDYQRASSWPKEGIFYWVWKASDGVRWQEA